MARSSASRHTGAHPKRLCRHVQPRPDAKRSVERGSRRIRRPAGSGCGARRHAAGCRRSSNRCSKTRRSPEPLRDSCRRRASRVTSHYLSQWIAADQEARVVGPLTAEAFARMSPAGAPCDVCVRQRLLVHPTQRLARAPLCGDAYRRGSAVGTRRSLCRLQARLRSRRRRLPLARAIDPLRAGDEPISFTSVFTIFGLATVPTIGSLIRAVATTIPAQCTRRAGRTAAIGFVRVVARRRARRRPAARTVPGRAVLARRARAPSHQRNLMRILQVVHGFPPAASGGTEVYVRDLAAAFAAAGDEVAVFTRHGDPQRARAGGAESGRTRAVHVFSVNNTFHSCESFESSYRESRGRTNRRLRSRPMAA